MGEQTARKFCSSKNITASLKKNYATIRAFDNLTPMITDPLISTVTTARSSSMIEGNGGLPSIGELEGKPLCEPALIEELIRTLEEKTIPANSHLSGVRQMSGIENRIGKVDCLIQTK